jgi:hypothetical protein
MKKALISPNEAPIPHIVGYELNPNPNPQNPTKYIAIFEDYPNSCRVAEVEENPFDVAPPLFWVDCEDDVVAGQFYYDTQTDTINPIVNAPFPIIEGLQTL